ncbi:MAG: translation elongation factor Ts [Proteobacteria bacterium]|jgi:elongation factor Ts|nr:translation elongation factor Ts [Pseudomonadota bacterium]
MAEINPSLVKTLREKTNAGMMDCKKALTEAGGDLEKAEALLRQKGIASAGKKAGRAAKEGVIVASIQASGRVGVIAEINCETDFVAKNDIFTRFVKEVAEELSSDSASSASTLDHASDIKLRSTGLALKDAFAAKTAELGERMLLRRFHRFEIPAGSEGVVASYIHLQGKVGVLVEVASTSAEAAKSDSFRDMVKDITLQIAAASPTVISRDQVDQSLVASEREIYKAQVQGKPENIVEKIVDGKMDKFYSTACLLEQACIKNPDITVTELLASKGKELGATLEVRRFARYMVGEDAAGAADIEGDGQQD